MRIFDAMEASASALTMERLRMDVIAHNLANLNTTRTEAGTPYRRRMVLQAERKETFDRFLSQEMTKLQSEIGLGVRATAIVTDETPFKVKYDPSHPDADENGLVQMPNVDMLQEITDMMVSTRIYEANVTALNAAKTMALKALEIGR